MTLIREVGFYQGHEIQAEVEYIRKGKTPASKKAIDDAISALVGKVLPHLNFETVDGPIHLHIQIASNLSHIALQRLSFQHATTAGSNSITVQFEKNTDWNKASKLCALLKKAIGDTAANAVEIKVAKDLQRLSVRTGKSRWKQISIAQLGETIRPQSHDEPIHLRRSITLEDIHACDSPLAKLLATITAPLLALYRFLTGKHKLPPIDLEVLQGVIGATPQHEKITMAQALSYWTTVLKTREAPSAERDSLIALLSDAERRAQQISALEGKEGWFLERAFKSFCSDLTASVKNLKEGERMLIPAGFWNKNEGAFRDCLLEVRRDRGTLSMRSFCLDVGVATIEDAVGSEVTNIEPHKLERDLPIIVALQLRQAGRADPFEDPMPWMLRLLIKTFFSVARWFNSSWPEPPKPPPGGFEATDLMEILGYPHTTRAEKTVSTGVQARPTKEASAARVLKTYIRAQIKGATPASQLNYKILKLKGEADLLFEATSTDRWQENEDYRQAVTDSARKLLSEIGSVRKKETFLAKRLAWETPEVSTPGLIGEIHALRSITTQLEALAQKASSWPEREVALSLKESFQTNAFGTVTIVPPVEPPTTPAISHVTMTSAVDREDFSYTFPDTTNPAAWAEGMKSAFTKFNIVFRRLLARGDYTPLEHLISEMGQSIPVRFPDGLTKEDAKELSDLLLNIYQATVSCCMLGGHREIFPPDLLTAINATRILFNELTFMRLGTKVRTYFSHEVLAFTHKAVKRQKELQDASRDYDRRTYLSPEEKDKWPPDAADPMRKFVAFHTFTLLMKMHTESPNDRFSSLPSNEGADLVHAFVRQHELKPLAVLPEVHVDQDMNIVAEPGGKIRPSYHAYSLEQILTNSVFRYHRSMPAKIAGEDICRTRGLDEFKLLMDKAIGPGVPARTMAPLLASNFQFLSDATMYDLLALAKNFPEALGSAASQSLIDIQISDPRFYDAQRPQSDVAIETLKQLSHLQQRFIKEKKWDKWIRVASIAAALCRRIGEGGVGKGHTQWLEEFEAFLQEAMPMKSDDIYLWNQEVLRIITEAYPTFESIDHRDNPVIRHHAVLGTAAYLSLHQHLGRDDDLDGEVEFKARAFVLKLQTLLPSMADKDQFLDEVILRLFPGTNLEKGPWTADGHFFTKGDCTIDIVSGTILRHGIAAVTFPSFLQEHADFHLLGVSARQVWAYQRTEHQTTHKQYEIFTPKTQPTVRIIIPLESGRRTAPLFQKQIGGVWHQLYHPQFLPEKTQREREQMEAMQRFLPGLLGPQKTEKPPEAVTSMPEMLRAISSPDGVWIKMEQHPSSMVFEGKEVTTTVRLAHKKGTISIEEISRNGHKIGLLREHSQALFSCLDPVAFGEMVSKKGQQIIFPRAHLRDPRATGKKTFKATKTEKGWAIDGLNGFLVMGPQVQAAALGSRSIPAGTRALIPPGLTSFHLMQKGSEQKILLPMVPLEPVYPDHTPGAEGTSFKQFSRFVAKARPVALPVDTPIDMLVLDVQSNRLQTTDPVANSYLAYMYLTQQRYDEAIHYLEVSRTNVIPSEDMQRVFSQLLQWPDRSEGARRVRIMAQLQMCAWPATGKNATEMEQHLNALNDIRLQMLHEAFSQPPSTSQQAIEQLQTVLASLPSADRLSFIEQMLRVESFTPKGSEERKGRARDEQKKPSSLKKEDVKILFTHTPSKPETLKLTDQFLQNLALSPDRILVHRCRDILEFMNHADDLSELRHALATAKPSKEPPVGTFLRSLLLNLCSLPSDKRRPFIQRLLTTFQEEAQQRVKKPEQKTTWTSSEQLSPLLEICNRWITCAAEIEGLCAQQPEAKAPTEQEQPAATSFDWKQVQQGLIQPYSEQLQLPQKLPIAQHPQSSRPPAAGISILTTLPPGRHTQYTDRIAELQSSAVFPIHDTQFDKDQFFDGFTPTAKAKLSTRLQDFEIELSDILAKEGQRSILDQHQCQSLRDQFHLFHDCLVTEVAEERHHILTLANPLPKQELEQFREALTPESAFIPLERLLGAYTRGRPEIKRVLQEYNAKRLVQAPTTDETVEALDMAIRKYLLLSVAQMHAKEVVDKATAALAATPTKDQLKELGSLVRTERFFSLEESEESDARLLLMLEYSNGYLLRWTNIDLVKKLALGENIVRQLPPGAGKTAVVMRLLASIHADGTRLSTLILPEWLYETNRKDLDRSLRALTGQDLFCLDVPTTRDPTTLELEDMLIRASLTMINRGVMLTTRLSLLTLRNLFEDLEDQISSLPDNMPDDPQLQDLLRKYQCTANLLALLKDRMRALTDEVDSLLDIHLEINRKKGEDVAIDPPKLDACVGLYRVLLKHRREDSALGRLAEAIYQNRHVDFPRTDLQNALQEWAHEYVRDTRIDPSWDGNQLVSYLCQLPQACEEPVFLTNSPLREEMVAAKVLLSNTIPHATLMRANNVKDGYGKHEGDKVGPYSAPNTPAQHSEFANEFGLMAFTVQDYIQTGVTHEQAQRLYEQKLQEADNEMRRTKMLRIQDTAVYREVSQWGVDLILPDEDEEGAHQSIEKMYTAWNATPEKRLEYCQRFVMPNLRHCVKQIRSTAHDLVDLADQFCGMTGTPYNAATFSDVIDKAGTVTVGSDGVAIGALIKHAQDKDRPIRVIRLDGTSTEELRRSLLHTTPEYDGIIDIGAYCKGQSAFALAQAMSEQNPETKFIVYINEKTDLVAYSRSTKTEIPFNAEAMPPQSRKTLYQVFIGADIKQKPKARFAVTVGNRMFMKDLIQGVMRLRQLPADQTVDFVMSREVEQTIRQLTGRTGDLTVQDIMAYCATNEDEFMKKDVLTSEKQKIARYPSRALFQARVAFATCPRSVAEIKDTHKRFENDIFPGKQPTLAELACTWRERPLTEDSRRAWEEQPIAALERMKLAAQGELGVEWFDQALAKLRTRLRQDLRLLPETETAAEISGEDQMSIAVAVEQQQVAQQQQQAEETEAFGDTKPPAWDYEGILYGHRAPSSMPFANDLNVSHNIVSGFSLSLYKDIIQAVVPDYYDSRTLVCCDTADAKSSYRDRIILGPTSYDRNHRTAPRLIATAKIYAGYVDFVGDEEERGLREYLGQFPQDQKVQLIRFINNHPYFKRGGKRLAIKEKKCDLGRVLAENGFPLEHIQV